MIGKAAIAVLARYAALCVLCLGAIVANAAPHIGKSAEALRLLEKSRRATGGASWDAISNIHFTIRSNIPSAFDRADEWIDLRGERVRQAFEETDGLELGSGRDKSWLARYDKIDTSVPSPSVISITYNEAFGFRFKHRAMASARIIGHHREDKRHYTIVQLVPEGGTALDYWIDDATALIAKVQFLNDDGKPTGLIEYDDYRRAGGVLLPFHQVLKRIDATVEYDTSITELAVNVPYDDATFEQASQEEVQGFLPGQHEIQMPFELYQDHIFIQVALNGHGPFHFMLDTGCNNTISTETMRAAQLQPGDSIDAYGFGNGVAQSYLVRVQTTSLGSLSLHKQTFFALDLPKINKIDGIIGYEWLKRLPMRIDYANRILTIYNPAYFQYDGGAQPVALHFKALPDAKTGKPFYPAPRVEAAIDGIAGVFDIDIGDYESILVSSEFSDRHALLRHYAITGTSTLYGVNNVLLSKVNIQIHSFRIGDNYIPNKTLSIAPPQHQGILADPDLSGNIGYGVLSDFAVTLDYRNQVMYLEPNNGLPTFDYTSALGAGIAP